MDKAKRTRLLNTQKYKIKLINQYEVFANVEGADNQYISSYGRLIRLFYEQPVFIPHHIDQAGESMVDVKWDRLKNVVEEPVASLVASAFLVNDWGYTYVWYKDGNRQNLDCRNLFYVADNEAQKVLSDTNYVKQISKRQKVKSIFNLNTKKLEQLYRDMLRRCDDPNYISKHDAYKDADVCQEWRQDKHKFYEWAMDNFYEYPRTLELDKDILSIRTGKRCYSPDNCCFVPKKVNALFRKLLFDNEPGITEKSNKDGTTSYSVAMPTLKSTRCYDNLNDARTVHKRNKLAMIGNVFTEFYQSGYDVPSYILDALREWYHAIDNDEIKLDTSGLMH